MIPRTIHGMSKTREYAVWAQMIDRCRNPKRKQFHRYGGRGITVCEEWRLSFVAFINHVGRRPSDHHTIERIDNDLGYFPGNVKWATRREQSYNRGDNKLDWDKVNEIRAMEGRTHRDIAKIFNINHSTVTRILNGRHWCG